MSGTNSQQTTSVQEGLLDILNNIEQINEDTLTFDVRGNGDCGFFSVIKYMLLLAILEPDKKDKILTFFKDITNKNSTDAYSSKTTSSYEPVEIQYGKKAKENLNTFLEDLQLLEISNKENIEKFLKKYFQYNDSDSLQMTEGDKVLESVIGCFRGACRDLFKQNYKLINSMSAKDYEIASAFGVYDFNEDLVKFTYSLTEPPDNNQNLETAADILQWYMKARRYIDVRVTFILLKAHKFELEVPHIRNANGADCGPLGAQKNIADFSIDELNLLPSADKQDFKQDNEVYIQISGDHYNLGIPKEVLNKLSAKITLQDGPNIHHPADIDENYLTHTQSQKKSFFNKIIDAVTLPFKKLFNYFGEMFFGQEFSKGFFYEIDVEDIEIVNSFEIDDMEEEKTILREEVVALKELCKDEPLLFNSLTDSIRKGKLSKEHFLNFHIQMNQFLIDDKKHDLKDKGKLQTINDRGINKFTS